MAKLNASFLVDGINAPTFNIHPREGESRPAVFVTIGTYGSEVTIWTREPGTLQEIAAVFVEAARHLDEAYATPVKGVDPRD